jgi:hypothetical protein
MFNFVIKANTETSEEYTINAFNYTKRYNIEVVSWLHVRIIWLYFCEAYIGIL